MGQINSQMVSSHWLCCAPVPPSIGQGIELLNYDAVHDLCLLLCGLVDPDHQASPLRRLAVGVPTSTASQTSCCPNWLRLRLPCPVVGWLLGYTRQ